MNTARLATSAEEFAAVAQLQADFNIEYDYPPPDPQEFPEHLARLYADGDTRVWTVSEDDGPMLGHGIVRLRLQTTVNEMEAYLAELYVVPDRRGQGLGTVLLQAIIDDVREQGATYIDLNTSEDDTSARAIYEKFGFDCHEGRGSGPMAIYYEKDLDPVG